MTFDDYYNSLNEHFGQAHYNMLKHCWASAMFYGTFAKGERAYNILTEQEMSQVIDKAIRANEAFEEVAQAALTNHLIDWVIDTGKKCDEH